MKKRISAFALALVMTLALLPAAALAANSDFVIEDGILLEYTGVSEDAVIPDGVTGIAGLAFSCRPPLKSVFIPASVTWIGDGVFFESGVTDIYYEGSKAQWEKISITTTDQGEYGNYEIFHATMHYNSPMPTAAPAAVEPLPFEDVAEKDWFYDYVRACYDFRYDGVNPIMGGTGATTFSPYDLLPEEQTAALAARLRAGQRGETIPAQEPGEAWYGPVLRYLEDLHLGITPGVQCTRARFLTMLGAVLEEDALESVYTVDSLPDTKDETVLRFYRAGILNGMDSYGSFIPSRTLSRAEAAAMVGRILAPELRVEVKPADYSPFRAAGVPPTTVFFTNGVTAEQYLGKVNELIASLEDLCTHNGTEFNWHELYSTYGEMTFLQYVTETALAELEVTRSMGTQYYGLFDMQVYYSRLIDLRGGVPLGSGN